VLGFVFRRQLLLWRSWRPWLSVFVFGVPSTVLLMYVSVSVTCTFDRLMGFQISHWAPTGHEGFALLLCHIFLLIAWSWTSGFARIALAANPLVERYAWFVSGSLFRGSLPPFRQRVTSEPVPVSVSRARYLGRPSGGMHRPPQTNPRIPSGRHHHGADGRCMDQQRTLDLQLAAALPRMVSGGDSGKLRNQ
jgi:hypothetical protein